MTTKFTIWSRRQYEVNTDPQRRCYNGCHYSSEMVWGEWTELYSLSSAEEAARSVADWRRINPTYQVKYLPKGEDPNA